MKILLISTLLVSLLSLLFFPVNILGRIGMFLCFILSAMGTAEGISAIAKYVSGASIKTPSVGTKAILGTVVCEANFLTGIITCVMLDSSIKKSTSNSANYIYFASGLFVGLCNYYSSLATGIICGIISMVDAKDPTVFFKIVILEIIPASVGLVGFIMGIVFNSKTASFEI
ncbi:V-type H+-transporting ATPase 21kDa proteolipid subunit [Enteropsectra breve]|nr:V-type H+-transporting ATPase 21kDa proteolipid subunit [Enteropsectra breve]